MQRSLIVILLAIVCGVSAAVGVNQLTPQPVAKQVETQTVYVAASPIRRGAKLEELDIKAVEWPVNLIPGGVVTNKPEALDRFALSAIALDEPLMTEKLSNSEGKGFASHSVPAGMRACTIQTSGPAASVSTFVWPGDKVDVLLNLRGSTQDATGGGSTLTLLQSAEVLAIDESMDVDERSIEMWIKNGVTSVTLLVTPEQAMLVSLGQAAGSMSLSLRNGDDEDYIADPRPVTLNQVRNISAAETFSSREFLKKYITANSNAASEESEEVQSSPAESVTPRVAESSEMTSPDKLAAVEREKDHQSFIYTLRGSQSGMVRVMGAGK